MKRGMFLAESSARWVHTSESRAGVMRPACRYQKMPLRRQQDHQLKEHGGRAVETDRLVFLDVVQKFFIAKKFENVLM